MSTVLLPVLCMILVYDDNLAPTALTHQSLQRLVPYKPVSFQ